MSVRLSVLISISLTTGPIWIKFEGVFLYDPETPQF